jgi:hypothetical protein
MHKEQNPIHRSEDSQSVSPEELQRELRIQHLINQLQELSGGAMVMSKFSSCPPEVFEAFLEEVLDFELEHARRKKGGRRETE